jgi:hypothetical protein
VSEPASDAELRRAIAAEHGLDPKAAPLLVGESIEELEASAAALARLIGERREEPEREPAPAPDVFGAARRAKDAKRRALLDALGGRAPQPRDEQGRFTGFDGGARQPMPTRRPPELEHNELVVRLAALSRTFGGGGF